jgi:hypothetical protein
MRNPRTNGGRSFTDDYPGYTKAELPLSQDSISDMR